MSAQLLELGNSFLVCHRDDRDCISADWHTIEPLVLGDILIFILVDKMTASFLGSSIRLTGFSINQYLDRFLLLEPNGNPKRRQELIDGFFSLIAEDYECLIDLGRNLENIDNLLLYLTGFLGALAGKTIVDYGCGTGLSSLSVLADGAKVIGIDRHPDMLRLAAARGLSTWTLRDLEQQEEIIDGSFASYVFHLLSDPEGIRLVWERTKPSGVLVANFHKDRGIEMVTKTLKGMGAVTITFNPEERVPKHGTYIAFVKSGGKTDTSQFEELQ